VVTGRVVLADGGLDEAAIVLICREENEGVAIGYRSPDGAAKAGTDVLEEKGVQEPCGLDGNGAVLRHGEQERAVGGRGPVEAGAFDVLQIEQCVLVKRGLVDVPAFEVGVEDEAECFRGVDGVADDEVCEPGDSGELLLAGVKVGSIV
jgi:hypothetical protein